jgi:hypothetical protein
MIKFLFQNQVYYLYEFLKLISKINKEDLYFYQA